MTTEECTNKAIADLREQFGIGQDGSRSTEKNGTFVIDTTEYTRREAVEILMDYLFQAPGINCLIETVGQQQATRFTIKPNIK